MKTESQKGSSLAVVICISALFLAFALAMLYTAGLLLSQANQRLRQERSYQLAQSFAKALGEELKRYQKPEEAPEKTFYTYACQFLDGVYGEYDPDHPEATVFHYTAAMPEGEDAAPYGEIRVVLYKEANQEQEGSMSGVLSPAEGPDAIINERILRYVFTVEVTAKVDGASYSYRTEYRQMAVYEAEFQCGDRVVVWNKDDNQWHYEASLGTPVLEQDGDIRYTFQPGQIKRCEFADAVYVGEES